VRRRLSHLAQGVVDAAIARIPQPLPPLERLQAGKIVSHRGEREGGAVENTLAAFDPVLAAGVWGLEFDVRWRSDGIPVVIHDPDAMRCFGRPLIVARSTFAQIRAAVPEIPSLEEVLARYGGKLHLMVELKDDHPTHIVPRRQTLQKLLAPLTPGEQFHILTLDPKLLRWTDFLPPDAQVLVGTGGMGTLSRHALREGLGGVAGHYLLMSERHQQAHTEARQQTGVGFITSRNGLKRALNRGVNWIFSNHAVRLERWRRGMVEARRG